MWGATFSDKHSHKVPDLLITLCLRSEAHLKDGPIETQQDAPRLVPDRVQAVGDAAQEELVAQTTPGGQTQTQFIQTSHDFKVCRVFNLVTLD